MDDGLLIFLIVIAVLFILAAVYLNLRKRGIIKFKINLKNKKAIELNREGKVDLKNQYLSLEEIKFLDFLNSIITDHYVVYPKVGVENLVKPIGNRMLYNSILGTYVDFCMFEKATMKPVLVFDLYNNSFGDEPLEVMSENVSNILKMASLPYISIQIKQKYNEEEMKHKIRYAIDEAYKSMLDKEEKNKM